MTTANRCMCGKPLYVRKTGECQACYNARYYREHPRDRTPVEWVPTKPYGPRCPPRTVCSYLSAHKRVHHYRGPARTYRCVDCSAPAAEWSYRGDSPREQSGPVRGKAAHLIKHTTWSPWVMDYEPRCQPCHRRHDREEQAA